MKIYSVTVMSISLVIIFWSCIEQENIPRIEVEGQLRSAKEILLADVHCDSLWERTSFIPPSIESISGTYEYYTGSVGQTIEFKSNGSFVERLFFEYNIELPFEARIGIFEINCDTLRIRFTDYIFKDSMSKDEIIDFIEHPLDQIYKLEYATKELDGSLFKTINDYILIVWPNEKGIFCNSVGVSIIDEGQVESTRYLLKVK